MDLSDYRADADLQRDGVSVPFGSFTEIVIRSASDEKFVNYWNRMKKPYRREIAAEKLPTATGRELLAKTIAQRMVLGWTFLVIPKSMFDEDFKESTLESKPAKHKDFEVPMVEISYSKKNCFILLNHENYGTFRGWIMEQAGEISTFQNKDFEDDLGN